MKRALLIFIVTFILLTMPLDTTNLEGSLDDELDLAPLDHNTRSADPGVLVDASPYLVLKMSGGDIPDRGSSWSQLLNSSGIVSRVIDVSKVTANPALLDDVPAIIVDASVGSGDGATVSQMLIDTLIQKDIALVLTGRSSWILHRLRGDGPPSLTAPATAVLLEAAEYAGAVFMSSPVSLIIGTQLTTETPVSIPCDQIQTEKSRLVDLTGASSACLASLRFDSYPLDVFLFSAEDPALLTGTGQGLLENVIAFSTALRETGTANILAELQAPEG
ncbi:MAG: hypothetical protein ACFFDD_07500, partial [Promethearchaeota archaeon]